jgi:hypothetical protein
LCGVEVHNPARATAFIRDPIERLKSAYSIPGAESWEWLVDQILSNERDPHWIPQAEQLGVADTFLPFELLGEFVRPHFHKSTPREIDASYRITELRNYYVADYWLRALTDGRGIQFPFDARICY